jgi:hypothetical protein
VPAEIAFGPWQKGLPRAERLARLRELRALAHVLAGPRHPFTLALKEALTDRTAVDRAGAALADLPTLTMRRLLATFAALKAPPKRRGRGGG